MEDGYISGEGTVNRQWQKRVYAVIRQLKGMFLILYHHGLSEGWVRGENR